MNDQHVERRISAKVPEELFEHAKRVVYWTPGLTMAELVADALTSEIERRERERGESFPERTGPLSRGVRKKIETAGKGGSGERKRKPDRYSTRLSDTAIHEYESLPPNWVEFTIPEIHHAKLVGRSVCQIGSPFEPVDWFRVKVHLDGLYHRGEIDAPIHLKFIRREWSSRNEYLWIIAGSDGCCYAKSRVFEVGYEPPQIEEDEEVTS